MDSFSATVAGLRGEGFADMLRRTGSFGALPGDTDAEATQRMASDIEASTLATSHLYASIALGLAGTTSGQYFSVPETGDDFLILYKNEAGVEVEVNRYPAKTALAAILASLAAPTGAALVGTRRIPAIDGGVLRTLEAILNDPAVSVKDFGAVGDGVADDTAAIQAAIDYVEGLTSPTALYLPRGNYRITATLNVSRCFTIYGDGQDQSVLVAATNIDILDCDIISASDRGMLLSNFGVKQTLAYASLTAGTGIKLHRAYCSALSNIRVVGCYNGIHAIQSPLSQWSGILIEQFKNCGMNFDGGLGFDVRVSNFTITGNNGANPVGSAGLRLYDMCDEFVFRDGVISTCVDALVVDSAVNAISAQPEFCRFSNVSFDSCLDGPKLDSCRGMVFAECFFSNRPGTGATLSPNKAVKGVTFRDSIFLSNGGNGLTIGALADDTTVDNCEFVNNSAQVPLDGHGILASNNATNFKILNNRFANDWGGAGTQSAGVRIDGAGCDKFTVIGNDFSASGGGFVNNSTGTDQNIAHNIGYRTSARGSVALVAGTAAAAFPTSFPSANYRLSLSTGAAGETLSWSSKTAAGFTVTSSNGSSTASVDWIAEL